MRNPQLKLPVIIDLQPLPEEQILRLPGWMKWLFVMLYLTTLVGLFVLLKESYAFLQLYQEKVEAVRVSQETANTIAAHKQQLEDFRTTQRNYDAYKKRQRMVARPGPLLNWVPQLVGRSQRAHNITIQQMGEQVNVSVTIEKGISENVSASPKAPADYQLLSANEETPKFAELPLNQKPGPKNEYIAYRVQLKKN